ncbi:MAG: response regulator [Hyphomicrobiaceae bacterium]|nr:MAG: response regulator [Hyphomicrobiaceae bacterium]
MIYSQTHSDTVHLWLAAAAPQAGGAPAEQGAEPKVETRSLRVLIVEDEFYISLHTRGLLEALGHVVVAVAVAADQAVSLAEREHPDVVLMDIRLIGSRDGIGAADEIAGRLGIGSIFVTANTDAQTRRRAEAIQPLGFLEKPLTEQRLRLGLSKLVA